MYLFIQPNLLFYIDIFVNLILFTAFGFFHRKQRLCHQKVFLKLRAACNDLHMQCHSSIIAFLVVKNNNTQKISNLLKQKSKPVQLLK